MNMITDFTTVENVINELKELKGATVNIFGQPTKLNEEFNPLLIDTIDVLESLKKYERDFKDYEDYFDFSDCKKFDNTYNYGSPLTHDLCYNIYESEINNSIAVSMCVHKYDDIRGNYTDNMFFVFDDEYTFLEELSYNSINDNIEIDDKVYSYEIDVFCDYIDIYDEDGKYLFYVCATDTDELKNEIIKKLNYIRG